MALQGAVPRLLMAKAPGMAWGYFLKTALRVDRPLSCSFGTSIGQTFVHSPQLVHFERSTYLASWRIFALKFPGSPSNSKISVPVLSSMFKCRPTSTSLGEITHMAQSLVGKVLSSWDMRPPMAEDFSRRYT